MHSGGRTSKCVFALASTALLACGSVSDKPGDDDGGDFTISASPTSLTVPIAGSATTTVTIARTGSVGDVMLSASGGANVTATFSPNPIPAGSTTSQATIKVAGGTAPGTTSVMLTGTAGSISHATTVMVTSTTITVTGTIRGNRSGVKVGLVGKQSVTSGAGGVFTFADVTPPYDMYTFADGGVITTPIPTVFLFRGLTRADPVVSAPAPFTLPGRILPCIRLQCPSASVSGKRTGSTNTDPMVFAWTGAGSFSDGVLNADGTYSGTVTWDSGTNSGALHALQLTRRASGAPNTFLGYAKSADNIPLMTGTDTTINLGFAPVNSTGSLTGTINAPAGYPGPSISLLQQFGVRQAALWTSDTTTTVDATFPLIAAAGGTSLFASTSLDGGTSTFVQPLTATVAVNFAMPAAAVLNLPVDAATGVTTATHFTWTSAPSTINEVNITTSTAAYKIFTTASDVTIPTVPELAMPANQPFSWRVVAYGPNASMDEAAASNELEPVSSVDYQGPAHAQTFSATRTFTSAP